MSAVVGNGDGSGSADGDPEPVSPNDVVKRAGRAGVGAQPRLRARRRLGGVDGTLGSHHDALLIGEGTGKQERRTWKCLGLPGSGHAADQHTAAAAAQGDHLVAGVKEIRDAERIAEAARVPSGAVLGPQHCAVCAGGEESVADLDDAFQFARDACLFA